MFKYVCLYQNESWASNIVYRLMTKTLLETSKFSEVFQSLYITLHRSHKKAVFPRGIWTVLFLVRIEVPGDSATLIT